MIEWTIMILLVIAILLFVLSFFRKDKATEVERQMENFSITLMQEIYQLKKKIRILEEELLVNGQDVPKARSTSAQKLQAEVESLRDKGFTLEIIAEKTGLTPLEVERLVASREQPAVRG
ncbi:hypothetical protein M3689_04525 [Alkalihalophilus marmarensis]|jgi:hypothetical protein|uniref:Uncharacterized protein n=1 Tax=Alkalihalophilus marmarensis DSM 21297 TaxID=1188261 RepID=U6ST43_9BACI|nr:hypothetical protein [Alkalihalophilus marmarensis]ERN54808.1 hypothetical protein A33I_05535 [Alkalihalophilus marmarensis DSM 21297]MCM3488573.1 hypothetical protein [Alkalihalophilus marmarensis]